MEDLKIERKKLLLKEKKKAIESIQKCFFPGCENKSINSHILQKNGILSELKENGHLFEFKIKPFENNFHKFEKIGINDAYSFKCFCQFHDDSLFGDIEKVDIKFDDYRTNLLFTIRILLYEKFVKMVVIKINEAYKQYPNLFKQFEIRKIENEIKQQTLGIVDLQRIESTIWNDLNEGTESFHFENKLIARIPICLSSFYTYKNTEEINKEFSKTGSYDDEFFSIYVNVFPYNNETIFTIGYEKKYERLVKGYALSFVKEGEKKLLRKLTNLLLFQCNTWILKPSFYKNSIQGLDDFFSDARKFAKTNLKERRFFDLNLFGSNFSKEIEIWKKKYFS
jgi:hypothetical protein